MNNLEKVEKVKILFKEALDLLNTIKNNDPDSNLSEIKDINSSFGSYNNLDDGGIFSQLNYMIEELLEELSA